MNLEILKRIGLSDGEIKVYSAILDAGVSSINSIHEKIGIDRRNIYDILNKLIEKGFISYSSENHRKIYKATNPQKIISFIEEKKSNLENIRIEVLKKIPEIDKVFNSKKNKIFSEIFKGPEGIKAIWDDMLKAKAVYWIGSGRYVPKMFPAFFKNWNKKRIHKKVEWFNLVRNEMRREIKAMPLEQIKFLPPEFSGNPTVVAIYENKVVNFLYGENLYGFVIESKELAENYKGYHQYLWKISKN